MYKRNNMLREKRKHANYKPNRRLDAKSSRGMIYENEELRLRTININAEVERGQSEIKTLKREREQLRREIWTLRDEYDKLENLLRIKGIDPDEFLNSNQERNDNVEEDNLSECSECSCESCCDEDCCQEKTEQATQVEKINENVNSIEAASSSADTSTSSSSSLNASTSHNEEHTKRVGKERLNLNFDHLSVVAEESSEGNSLGHSEEATSIPINDLSAFLHKADSLSPLSYLQKLNPPLSHFENLPYDKIGDSVDLHGNILPTSSAEPIIYQQNPQINQPSSTPVTQLTIEEIPTTPSPTPVVKKESRLKHFFSPIKRKVSMSTPIPPPPPSLQTKPPSSFVSSQPDLFINNVLPNNLSIQNQPTLSNSDIITNNFTNVDHSNTNTATTTSSFQTGGNLEELLYDIENLSKDIMELQTHCADMPVEQSIINTNNPQKPFRSELNLVLSYPKNFESQVDENANNTSTLDAQQLQNPLYLQNLPSPFPTFPSSPITPPINFKADDHLASDFSHLNFAPIDTSGPIFSSNSSIFCTVSAPSTPALDRKCIDKFCATETNADRNDKKKAKRVSIVNVSKEDGNDGKAVVTNCVVEEPSDDTKEGEKKTSTDTSSNSNIHHHSHVHKSHSHSHLHSPSKRRMSLDNSTSQAKHKNHRQISENKINRRESNRSSNSFKKRSRSDSTFPYGHADHEGGGTSMSERYSNSIASSRESSTSLSLNNKRRISITSYGNSKKIPWVNLENLSG